MPDAASAPSRRRHHRRPTTKQLLIRRRLRSPLAPAPVPRSPPRREGNSSSLTSGRRLYVAGFAFAVKEDELQEKFEEFGRVSSVSIVKRPDGESRGFGFVVYDDERDADKVRSTRCHNLLTAVLHTPALGGRGSEPGSK